ncbi:universal stress protein [Legionella maioricensis]|uniref:Universal stress protein n=1 Tax=Legionella maioricensis TaxID=2896528 RepID=A0A9X2D203_9GAMM|nr:universal stress protein [Legionella maioricensis]MCL9684958.1 universal stress protein [Legionella maioricensis]MCL9688210.1 universal stress protein [Legionella maioricensis]
MYKHILVAVDESDTAKQALREAINLSQDHKAKLRLVHVVNEFYSGYLVAGVDYEQIELAFKQGAQKLLDEMEAMVRKEHMECDSQLIEIKTQERISEKIVEAAKDWPADLLVVGTHGRRGFQHFILGSVAEGVIRRASIPVLLVRGK